MEVKEFVSSLKQLKVGFFTGIPDSQLKELSNYLMNKYGVSDKHIIASNEGNAVGLAAGYHLATGNTACVYMQNSGLGNIVNPVASLLNDEVYAIPAVFIIGWRGEPGVLDEPQHIFQGKITLKLLEVLSIDYYIVDTKTTIEEIQKVIVKFKKVINKGKSVAFVVRKGSLLFQENTVYKNDYSIKREDAIESIVNNSDEDIIVSTTGKISRELYEIRERKKQFHKFDFLTIGSMGHSSSVGLGIALNTKKRVWCLDGDGSLLMHTGAIAVIGSKSPNKFIHVVLNNAAHESVGGMPTVSKDIDFSKLALSCGYKKVLSIDNISKLDDAIKEIKSDEVLSFLEIKVAIGSRSNLGRPITTAIENKDNFVEYIRKNNI